MSLVVCKERSSNNECLVRGRRDKMGMWNKMGRNWNTVFQR